MGGGWEGGREREEGGEGGRDDCYTYYSDGTKILIITMTSRIT